MYSVHFGYALDAPVNSKHSTLAAAIKAAKVHTRFDRAIRKGAKQTLVWNASDERTIGQMIDTSRFAIRHDYPSGGHVGDGFIHSGNSATLALFTASEAADAIVSFQKMNPGHTFEMVAL